MSHWIWVIRVSRRKETWEFLQLSDITGPCFSFYVNCAPSPVLCQEGRLGEQEVINTQPSQDHRDQMAQA